MRTNNMIIENVENIESALLFESVNTINNADNNTVDNNTVGDVGRFMAMAVSGPLVAGLVVSTVADSVNPLVASLVVALAMPAPLIAAIVLEPGGLRRLGQRVQSELRNPLPIFVLPILAFVTFVAASLLLTATAIGTDGLATTPELLAASVADQLPADQQMQTPDLPPFAILVVVGFVAGIFAGFTINGLFAFGEEYGWRQFLWHRLQPLGRLGTVGIMGVLWGLWHAPLILLVGLNYPEHRLSGVAVMVAFAVAASWPLDEIRRATGGAVGPAVFHGMINGIAGVLVIVSLGSELLTPPAGLIGALAMLPAGAAVRLAAGLGRRRRQTTTTSL